MEKSEKNTIGSVGDKGRLGENETDGEPFESTVAVDYKRIAVCEYLAQLHSSSQYASELIVARVAMVERERERTH